MDARWKKKSHLRTDCCCCCGSITGGPKVKNEFVYCTRAYAVARWVEHRLILRRAQAYFAFDGMGNELIICVGIVWPRTLWQEFHVACF